jgi:hypothetical protein
MQSPDSIMVRPSHRMNTYSDSSTTETNNDYAISASTTGTFAREQLKMNQRTTVRSPSPRIMRPDDNTISVATDLQSTVPIAANKRVPITPRRTDEQKPPVASVAATSINPLGYTPSTDAIKLHEQLSSNNTASLRTLTVRDQELMRDQEKMKKNVDETFIVISTDASSNADEDNKSTSLTIQADDLKKLFSTLNSIKHDNDRKNLIIMILLILNTLFIIITLIVASK